jgi:DNA-binding SARP family transcriptional activator
VVQSLRVRLLGDLQVEGCDPARLGRRRVRRLLKILALHHDRHLGPDRLADCLWGDDPPARPADQISVLVSRLRGVLGADRLRELASQMLAADPYDETALRALMEALTRSGRPASALAAYSGARERLAEDLGAAPSTETEALHTAILLGELPLPECRTDPS